MKKKPSSYLQSIALDNCRWSSPGKGDGIIVGSDVTQEWLLPWWWDHYHRSNTHPVTFVDFGMTPEMQQWCQQRGHFISLPIADVFVTEKPEIDPTVAAHWEKAYGSKFWLCRNAWFKKPLACLLSPYKRTLWIDLDCEVRGSVKPLFPLCEKTGISIASEWTDDRTTKIGVNSGVIAFKHGIPLFETWANLSIEQNGAFRGDQEVLTQIIQDEQFAFQEMPPIYNWSRRLGENPNAIIFHWHDDHGKHHIHYQITKATWNL